MSLNPSPVFTGCAAALVTPFLPDGSIDQPALRRLISIQIEARADAIVLLGTTGEPSTLTMKERELVIRTGTETIANKIPLIIGTGSNDTKKAVEYARQAKELGANAQLTVTPYYNKTTQAGLIRHYNMIMDSCELPLIAYNVPGRTGLSLHADTIMTLTEHPNFSGIKEASGNTELTTQILERTQQTLPVYSGCDELILPLMSLGASGAISVCANCAPSRTQQLTKACLEGDFHSARLMQMKLMPLIRALFAQVNPIPVKAALSLMGLIHNQLRLPLTPLEEPYRDKLRQVLIDCELIPDSGHAHTHKNQNHQLNWWFDSAPRRG